MIKKPFDFEPKTLGEHIKKRRFMEGLFLEQLAARLGVTESTVINWEKGHNRCTASDFLDTGLRVNHAARFRVVAT